MANPLGISTGQGKGLAQVFGDTYNDYYKQKADEGAKKKAELEAAMAKSSAGVWDRDLGLFKPMREELRKYVQDNARDIIDGKFDANVGWQAKQDELLQFINSSKAAKEFYEKNAALYNKNPKSYSNYSKRDLDEYAKTAGRFDSNIFLESMYNANDTQNDIMSDIKNIQYTTDPITGESVANIGGKNFVITTSEQKKNAVRGIVEGRISAAGGMFPRQVAEHWTQDKIDNLIKTGENMLGREESAKQVAEYSSDTYGGAGDNVSFEFSSNPTEITMNTPYGIEGEAGDLTYNEGSVPVINQLAFEAGISFKGNPSTDAIPLSGEFKRSVIRDGKEVKIGGEVGSGKTFKLADVKKGYEGDWTVKSSGIVPTFPSGYKSKNGTDIGGMLVDNSSIGTDRFKQLAPNGAEKRYYATVQNQYGDQVLEPFYKVLPSIRQQYTSKRSAAAWDKFYNDTKNYLIEQGLSKAYKDFTGKEMPKAKNNVPSSGKTAAQIAAELAKKNK